MDWNLVTSVATLLGVFVAAFELRSSARSDQFSAFMELEVRWSSSEAGRRKVRYGQFSSNLIQGGSDADRELLRSVVDILNLIGMLVEEKLVPPKLIFSLMSVEILRLTYRLTPFIENETNRIGIPYGQRVLRLRERAALYCSVRPNLSRAIYVRSLDGKDVECAFKMDKTNWGRPLKRLECRFRNFLEIY